MLVTESLASIHCQFIEIMEHWYFSQFLLECFHKKNHRSRKSIQVCNDMILSKWWNFIFRTTFRTIIFSVLVVSQTYLQTFSTLQKRGQEIFSPLPLVHFSISVCWLSRGLSFSLVRFLLVISYCLSLLCCFIPFSILTAHPPSSPSSLAHHSLSLLLLSRSDGN